MIIRTAASAWRRRWSAEGAAVTRDEILDKIQAAMLAGDSAAVQEIEARYAHVAGMKLAVFLLNEGGATVYSDEELIKHSDQQRTASGE